MSAELNLLDEDIDARSAGHAANGHEVQLYESDAFLCEVVASYLAEGSRAGAPLLVIATEAHRDQFSTQLVSDGVDVRAASASGQLTIIDAHDALSKIMIDGMPHAGRFHAQIGGVVQRVSAAHPRAHLRAYGEMVDILWREGNREAAIRLEDLWTELSRAQPFSLLCAYAMENFRLESDLADFSRVCQSHTRVVPTEKFMPGESPDLRTREIARLQQRARALENEIEQRSELERSLRDALADRKRMTDALERREDELRQQNQKLAAALRAKDEFLAMLGHELRNPLAPILTALELERARGADSRGHAIIGRQVRHLMRLVDDLLDVSRMVSGKVELRKRRVELAEVVARGIELCSPLLEQRRHALEVQVPRAVVVDVDPDRIAQVVSNLVTNAAKYSEPGSTIIVAASSSGATVRLSVRDQGVGIPPEMIDSVFDAFVQQPQALDRARGGLGLGLTIVRNLVELHGGTVSARSEGPGLGSELVVELPAATSPAPEVPPARSAPGRSCVTGKRILVVDDNEDAASLMAELLVLLGHEPVVAHDGLSALEVAASFAPDMALLDIGLPVMNGYDLARRLRETCPETRLIALTGYGQDTDQLRTSEAGFAVHLVKPVDLGTLARVLEESPTRPVIVR
jgi:signal transduction histidine kinase